MNDKIYPISMTVIWGVTFSTALNNWTTGMCMGIMMGMAFGLFGGENDNE